MPPAGCGGTAHLANLSGRRARFKRFAAPPAEPVKPSPPAQVVPPHHRVAQPDGFTSSRTPMPSRYARTAASSLVWRWATITHTRRSPRSDSNSRWYCALVFAAVLLTPCTTSAGRQRVAVPVVVERRPPPRRRHTPCHPAASWRGRRAITSRASSACRGRLTCQLHSASPGRRTAPPAAPPPPPARPGRGPGPPPTRRTAVSTSSPGTANSSSRPANGYFCRPLARSASPTGVATAASSRQSVRASVHPADAGPAGRPARWRSPPRPRTRRGLTNASK